MYWTWSINNKYVLTVYMKVCDFLEMSAVYDWFKDEADTNVRAV